MKHIGDSTNSIWSSASEAGGDDKQASKLLKEFLLEVQKAKVNSGFDLHRPPPKTKSSDSLLAFDHRNPTKIQRSKTDLGLTPHPLSARGEEEYEALEIFYFDS